MNGNKTSQQATRLLQAPLLFILCLDSQWCHLVTAGVT